jgi:hypothetical protein
MNIKILQEILDSARKTHGNIPVMVNTATFEDSARAALKEEGK